MDCPQCGQQLGGAVRFCTACGRALARPPPASDQPPATAPVRTAAEFRAFYEQTLLPDLRRIDGERKSVRLRIIIFWLVTLGLVALILMVGNALE